MNAQNQIAKFSGFQEHEVYNQKSALYARRAILAGGQWSSNAGLCRLNSAEDIKRVKAEIKEWNEKGRFQHKP